MPAAGCSLNGLPNYRAVHALQVISMHNSMCKYLGGRLIRVGGGRGGGEGGRL